MGVPARYIKDAPIDWDTEIFTAALCNWRIGKELVPPPSIGTWALLEAADCDFVHPIKPATPWGAYVAFYIMAKGRNCAAELREWIDNGGRDRPAPDIAQHWASVRLEKETEQLPQFEANVVEYGARKHLTERDFPTIKKLLEVSWSGYAMIPSTGPSTHTDYVYGLDTIASIIAGIGADMGIPWDTLIWETPCSVVGHVAAQKAAMNGKKGVSRPKDAEDIKLQLRLAREREVAGLLHPWEEDNPLDYGVRPRNEETQTGMSYEEEYRLAELQHAARAKLVEKAQGN